MAQRNLQRAIDDAGRAIAGLEALVGGLDTKPVEMLHGS
jgi:hypothetical protein